MSFYQFRKEIRWTANLRGLHSSIFGVLVAQGPATFQNRRFQAHSDATLNHYVSRPLERDKGEKMLRKMTQTVRIIAAGFAVLLAWSSLAVAQSFPRLKPIPPRRGAIASAARPATPSKPSSWTPLTNQPAFLLDGASNPILLTDGTVLVQDAGFQDWWKLTPDATGSYVNGTWSQVASLPPGYSPLYHSSAVLPDGRLIIEGGEYNFLVPSWTNLGAI